MPNPNTEMVTRMKALIEREVKSKKDKIIEHILSLPPNQETAMIEGISVIESMTNAFALMSDEDVLSIKPDELFLYSLSDPSKSENVRQFSASCIRHRNL